MNQLISTYYKAPGVMVDACTWEPGVYVLDKTVNGCSITYPGCVIYVNHNWAMWINLFSGKIYPGKAAYYEGQKFTRICGI